MRALLLAIPLCFMASMAWAADMPKVGDKAPEFELRGSDGKLYSSKEFLGKKAVVIAWFPKAFTGGCTKECKAFKADGDLLKKYEVAYFTASTDTVDENTKFAKSLEVDYPILSDPDTKVASAFGVLRADGKLANRVTFIIGSDGKILAVDDKVKTETHAKDVAEQLEKLKVPKKS